MESDLKDFAASDFSKSRQRQFRFTGHPKKDLKKRQHKAISIPLTDQGPEPSHTEETVLHLSEIHTQHPEGYPYR